MPVYVHRHHHSEPHRGAGARRLAVVPRGRLPRDALRPSEPLPHPRPRLLPRRRRSLRRPQQRAPRAVVRPALRHAPRGRARRPRQHRQLQDARLEHGRPAEVRKPEKPSCMEKLEYNLEGKIQPKRLRLLDAEGSQLFWHKFPRLRIAHKV